MLFSPCIYTGIFFHSPPLLSFLSFFFLCSCDRLRPRGWGLHPHLLGGLPAAPGEGSTRGESWGAGISVGQQDQAHQSLCHHPGQTATDWTHKQTLLPPQVQYMCKMLRVNTHMEQRRWFAWSALSFWFANCFDFGDDHHICKKM